MEERGPIQIIPPGLLNLLQLKADGRSVSKLGDTCVPSLEMSSWWLRAQAEIDTAQYQSNIAAGTLATYANYGAPNQILVPNGQWWYVHEYAAVATPGAGTATNVRLARAFVGPTTRYSGLGEQAQLIANSSVLLTAGDFWCAPGTLLGFYADVVTGGAGLTVVVRQLRFTRLGA